MQVVVVQPTVPTYRVEFFNRLAETPGYQFRVLAAVSAEWGLPAGVRAASWLTDTGKVSSWFGGRIVWQHSVKLPTSFGRGDVLVVTGNPRILSNVPLIVRAHARGARVVWWGHGWSPTSKKWRTRVRYAAMRMCEVILVYAEAEVDPVRIRSGFSGPIVGLNNSLDPAPMIAAQNQLAVEDLEHFRTKHELDGKRVLLFCGRLRSSPSTELATVVRALASAGDKSRAYRLAIVGRGEEEAVLRKLSMDLNVSDRILWVGEEYKEQHLALWFLSASCFIYPGPIGLSLLHSFIYGLPVITHRGTDTHNPEIHALREGFNGAMFERNSPADCWRAIESVCLNSDLRDSLAQGARQTGLSDWSFDKMLSNFRRAIHSALVKVDQDPSTL